MLELIENNFLSIISCTFIVYRPPHDPYDNGIKGLNLIPFDDCRLLWFLNYFL